LAQQYQDFAAQRQHPYQQLSFMSDMLRGLPLSQTAQTMYQQPASVLSQIGGLGAAGLGAYMKTAKEGGQIKEYGGLENLALHNMTKD